MKFSNGNTEEWDFIHHDGAAAVIPVMEDGKILMVKQYRNALERDTLEIPAGKLDDPNEGVICEGRRCGRGVQYDRNGNVMIDGEWLVDEELKTNMTISEESTFLHSRIEELIVSNNCCNGEEWKVLEFGLMPFLRDLHIGDYCFKEVDRMELIGLNYLERVVIGKHCPHFRRWTYCCRLIPQ